MSTAPVLTHGLSAQVDTIAKEANELRKQGQVISFREASRRFMLKRLGKKEGNLDLTDRSLEVNNGPEMIFAEANILRDVHTVRDLVESQSFSPNLISVIPEVMLESIQMSVLNDDFTGDFVSVSSPIKSRSDWVTLWPRHTKQKTRKSAEGADPRRSKITLKQKMVYAEDYKHAFDMTYKAIKHMTLDMLAENMRLAADNLNVIRRAELVNVMVNGDGGIDEDKNPIDDEIATIGIENTTSGFQYIDLLRVWVRMGSLGRMPDAIIANETNGLVILQLEEFKKRATGTTDKSLRLRQPLPTSQNLYIFNGLTDDYILMVDTSAVIGRVFEQAPMVESDKDIRQQIVDMVYSESFGFYTRLPLARVRFDLTKTYTGNEFPAWFAAHSYAA